MLALSIPTLDNTTKKIRTNEETGYEFGMYTDKEWGIEILNSQFAKYDAEILEEKKRNQSFFETLYGYAGSGVTRVLAGVSSFAQDIYNIGEGLLNIFINWSGDENAGNRFLAAFNDDEGEPFDEVSEALEEAAFEFERDYATGAYDAVAAYETGVGYTTWGRWWSGGMQSIGYMLPSILFTKSLSLGTKLSSTNVRLIGSGTFYGGIASSNIKDTVEKAKLQGLSYTDLNAGEVLSNAAGKAALQWGVEILLSKVLGWSFTDKALRGGRVAETAAKNR